MLERQPPPSPAELARLLLALERDEDTPTPRRAARDRALRSALAVDASATARVRHWLDHVDTAGGQTARDAETALRGVTSLLIVIGLLVGIGTATGVLYYDGGGRVNVLAVLGVLVGLPLLLITLTWLVACVRNVPVIGDSLQWLGGASPGRWVPTLGRLLSADRRRALEVLLGLRLHDEAGIAPVRRWLIARWSHVAGVAFFVGVLAVFLMLVLFTDLAFGWSTTLHLSGDSLERLVRTLAAPWAWLLSDAVPTREVIDATRYYRSEGAVSAPADPALLGRWWSFLILAIAVYGLLPRILSALIARKLLRGAVAAAFTGHPQARTLLDRLTTPPVESQGDASESEQADVTVDPGIVWPPREAGRTIVNWSGVPVDDAILLEITGGQDVVQAGGSRALAEDQALLDRLSGDARNAVLVACKSWEPPVLDLEDFLADLGAGVEVMPVRVEAGRVVAASARDREVWQRAFAASKHRLVSPPEAGS